MQKEFKRGILKSIHTLFSYLIGSVFVGGLVAWWFNNLLYGIIAGVVVIAWPLFDFYRDMKKRIVVDNNTLTIHTPSKSTHYKLDEVGIKAKSVNDEDFTLTITFSDGKRETIDCSYLSSSSFDELLNELGIQGDKQQPIKLDTQKK